MKLQIGYYYTITLSGKTWQGLVVGIHEPMPPDSPFGFTVGIQADKKYAGQYRYDDIANNAVEVGPAANAQEIRAQAAENEKIAFDLLALYLARKNAAELAGAQEPATVDNVLKQLSKDATAILNDYRRGKRIKGGAS